MQRIKVGARPGWAAKLEAVGCTYHSSGLAPTPENDGIYWHEDDAYKFTTEEVDVLEAATAELHRICLLAVDHAVRHPEVMATFGLDGDWAEYVARSWNRRDPTLMGRFDLAFDPVSGSVKMLEYNADTPTTAIETSLVQWFWLKEKMPDADQFNSFHEKLLAEFGKVATRIPAGVPLWFSSFRDTPEENQHSLYFRDLAGQAGIETRSVAVEDIGWAQAGPGDGWFVGPGNEPIRFMHKLDPWEWRRTDPYGPNFLLDTCGILEPVWKMLLSNKALLPLLWELFPGHANLLPAYWEPGRIDGAYVAKAVTGREGQNVSIFRPGQAPLVSGGTYGGDAVVYQALAPLPRFDGWNVVLGSWIVGDESAGLIVREGPGDIITGNDRCVPHWFA